MSAAQTILLVEDEPAISEVVKTYLERAGYRVRSAGSVRQALMAADAEAPDLILLDLILPDGSGETVCQHVHRRGDVPVVILTSRSREEEIIAGFALGVDDYVTKPFSPRELTARVQAVLRRTAKLPRGEVRSYNQGQLVIDWDHQQLTVRGRHVECTRTELELLGILTRHPGRTWSRERLMAALRGVGHERDVRTIDAHVKKLRAKLEDGPDEPQYIRTVWGTGYRWGGVLDA